MEKDWPDFVKLINPKTGDDDLENTVLLGGPEDFFVRQAVDRIVGFYTDEMSKSFDLELIDYEEQGIGNLKEACQTAPIFSKKRLVVVKNLDKKGAKEVIDAVGKKPDYTKLVLTTKIPVNELALNKKAQLFSFEPLRGTRLNRFIASFLGSRGKSINPNDRNQMPKLRMIAELSGYTNRNLEYNLYNLVMDLEKVAAYDRGPEVSQEAIEAGLSKGQEMAIWDMIEESVQGRKQEAMEHLSSLLQGGDSPENIMAQLVRKIEQIYMVKELTDAGYTMHQIEKTLKIPGFQVKKAYNVRTQHSYEKLRQVMMRAYETDVDIKTGKMDKELGLELLVLSFDRKKQASYSKI